MSGVTTKMKFVFIHLSDENICFLPQNNVTADIDAKNARKA